MLKNTFIHIQGIGTITEQRLWESGLRDWDAFTDDISIPLSGKRKYLLQKGIDESRQHLYQNNPVYFSKCLPANQSWRFFPAFRNSIAYLDIETTGLDRYFNDITTIALYDGHEIKTYVHGQNLEDFIEDIQKYKVIVTYNGKSFDIPFIESFFNIRLNHAQIDLRYVLYSLGYRGGLKGVERQLGTDRGNLRDVDGFFAVLLWDEYLKTGDQKALDTLLAYNDLNNQRRSEPTTTRCVYFVWLILLLCVLNSLFVTHSKTNTCSNKSATNNSFYIFSDCSFGK